MTRLEDITKKYPFMYEINGMVYCIGQGAFYTYANQIGLEYFRKYREEVMSLGRERIERPYLDHREVEKLVHYYSRVMTYSEPTAKAENPAIIKGRVLEFLDTIDSEEREKLSAQLEDYVHVFRHYNRNSIQDKTYVIDSH